MLSHIRKLCGKPMQILGTEKGQGLVEYALILVLIALVVMAGVKGIGSAASSTFSHVASNITTP